MSDIRFPMSLKPIVNRGYSQSRGSNIWRNPVQGGAPRQGRDTYFEPVPIQVSLLVSSLGRQAFLSFLNNIHGGADSFIMALDSGMGIQDHQVSITSDISDSTNDGLNWAIGFTATAERTAIQEDTCLTANLPDLYGCYGDGLNKFLAAYNIYATAFPRIWDTSFFIDLIDLDLDPRVMYEGPSVLYSNRSSDLVSSLANEWPVTQFGGMSRGRISPYYISENRVINSRNLSDALWFRQRIIPTLSTSDFIISGATYMLTPTTDNGVHTLSQNIPGNYAPGETYTFSVLFKRAGYTFARLRAADETTHISSTVVDLTNGVITEGGASGTIAYIGDQWYSVTQTIKIKAGGATALNIGLWVYQTATTNSFPGDGVSGVLCSAPQLEKSTISSAPIVTDELAVALPPANAKVSVNTSLSVDFVYSDNTRISVPVIDGYATIPPATDSWSTRFLKGIEFK